MAKVASRDGVMVRVEGRFVTLAKDAEVPADADKEHVALLEDRGLVVEGEAGSGIVAPDRAAPFVPSDPPADDNGGDGGDEDDKPAKSASRGDWDEYAKSQGMSDEEIAQFSSKEALQQHFGVE